MSNVFVIGATGYVGGKLARHLAGANYRVSGLARSDETAAKLTAHGIAPVAGDLDERLDEVIAAALAADATIYAAQVAEFDRRILSPLADLANADRVHDEGRQTSS